MRELLNRVLPHLSSITLVGVSIIYYILGNHQWVDQFLPANGKPLVIFLILALVVVYELLIHGQKQINYCLDKANTAISDILIEMEKNALKQTITAMYFRIDGADTMVIDNQDTIKELYELKESLVRLKVNSYHKHRLQALCDKIKL